MSATRSQIRDTDLVVQNALWVDAEGTGTEIKVTAVAILAGDGMQDLEVGLPFGALGGTLILHVGRGLLEEMVRHAAYYDAKDSPTTARAPRESSQVVGAVSGAPVPQTVAAPDTNSGPVADMVCSCGARYALGEGATPEDRASFEEWCSDHDDCEGGAL